MAHSQPVLGLIALIVMATSVALVVLPVWSFIRTTRLSREVAELRTRVATLERQARPAAPPPGPATPVATPADTPVPPVDGAPAPVGPGPAPDSPAIDAAAGDPAHPGWTPTMPGPEVSPPSPVPVGPASPPPHPRDVDDLEARVGGRWLLYAGVTILLLGVSFFLKYAFDNDWIGAGGRVTMGLLGGGALVGAGSRTARTLRAFGLALTGAGLAALYLSIYAAFDFYALIGAGVAFAGMTVVTLLATWLAHQGGAQSVAMVAAIGGYATPFLIGPARPDPDLLFAYGLVLGGGVLVLVQRHAWPLLAALAYAATAVTIGAWAAEHYTSSLWLRVLAWLSAFCVLFLEVLRTLRAQPGALARLVCALLWSAPVLYHLSAVALTFDQPPALHIYLIVATVVALFVTAERPSPWWRLPVLLGGVLPLLAFVEVPRGGSWLGPNVVTTLAVGGMHLLTMVDRSTRQARRLDTGDLLLMHLTMIGIYGVLVAILRDAYPQWLGGTGAVLSIAAAGLWFFYERRDAVAALHAAGLAFALLAMALAQQFDGRVVVIAWAVEGGVAAWVGVRAGNLPFRAGGLALLGLAAARLADGFMPALAAGGVLWNDRTAATAVVVLTCYVLAWHWRREPGLAAERLVPLALHALASGLTLVWLSAEVDAYWSAGGDVQARLARELSRSLAWGAYGSLLIVVGLWRSLASLRWIGILTIGLTVLKVFFVDLSALGGIYRVVGFLVLGVLLVAVSYLYQRGREQAPTA